MDATTLQIDLLDTLITDVVIRSHKNGLAVGVREEADVIIRTSGCSPAHRPRVIQELSRRCILAGLILEFKDTALVAA